MNSLRQSVERAARSTFVAIAFLGALFGCAANVQGLPKLVGVQDGKPLYSIDGFTDWGETTEADAVRYANRFSHNFCKTDPVIVRVETTDARNLAGARFLRWVAVYTCDQLN
jgi:hypothetical protein